MEATTLTGQIAPEFSEIKGWLNTPTLTMTGLRGKVVFLDFWTYSCVNCIRTLPHMKQLYAKYVGEKFTLVGVHTPEFAFEKIPENVADAVRRFDIKYPVAIDSDNATWKLYGNQYWPRQTLMDSMGRIRWEHAGEGDYDKMEDEIRKLLAEIGQASQGNDAVKHTTPKSKKSLFQFKTLTPETYTGSLRSKGFGNGQVCVPGSCTRFIDPGKHERGVVYLSGDWEQTQESVTHATGDSGYVLLQYTATNANAVMGTTHGNSARIKVSLDGKPLPKDKAGRDVEWEDGQAILKVREHRLYDIVRTKGIETHELKLLTDSEELQLYTYTFG
jgi:thiol-disulfide isomerase/thioredoxin